MICGPRCRQYRTGHVCLKPPSPLLSIKHSGCRSYQGDLRLGALSSVHQRTEQTVSFRVCRESLEEEKEEEVVVVVLRTHVGSFLDIDREVRLGPVRRGQIHSPLASPSSSASLVNPAVRPEKPSTNLLISTFRDAPV